MEIKITPAVHPYERTKDDFILRGAYSELVMILEKSAKEDGGIFYLEDKLRVWENANIAPTSAKAVAFNLKFRQLVSKSSENITTILRELKANKENWLEG